MKTVQSNSSKNNNVKCLASIKRDYDKVYTFLRIRVCWCKMDHMKYIDVIIEYNKVKGIDAMVKLAEMAQEGVKAALAIDRNDSKSLENYPKGTNVSDLIQYNDGNMKEEVIPLLAEFSYKLINCQLFKNHYLLL